MVSCRIRDAVGRRGRDGDHAGRVGEVTVGGNRRGLDRGGFRTAQAKAVSASRRIPCAGTDNRRPACSWCAASTSRCRSAAVPV
ncbi:hypothetical protein SacglDRAFT_01463 [Saccharomonospora glauca K62]|uniref:Uncharacterized protein n=1 Tax=Saccharomonospora glauca K62 TaxID=928724 RepID=I1D0B1_9PSEU|nr:hypothetical protein SacglDRAFT_01463 [Saccharomonospora glauca K62]